MTKGTPPAETHIDEDLVRALLSRQHPDLADRSLTFFGEGWDNVMYRLGDELSVRLPRRQVVADLIGHEQRYLPMLAPDLPLPIPAPVRVGHPDPDVGYPWPWSVLPWLPGEPADLSPPGAGQGQVLADFLLALHRPAPDDAPHNPGRGVPLADRAAAINDRIERLGPNITERVRRAWRDAVAAPRSNRRSWVHGDLHAANVLVDDGTFSAVIDWVDICAGDGATDLAAIWMLLPEPEERRAALDRYQPDDALHRRAIGWAVFFGTILLETGLVDNPRYRALGTAILTRIHHDTSE